MSRRLGSVPCHESAEAVRAIIEGVFAELTGHALSHLAPIFIERYSHGGMSSGHVCPEFWRDEAFPLLLARHAELVCRKHRSENAEAAGPLPRTASDDNGR
jgi:hypothetical protein